MSKWWYILIGMHTLFCAEYQVLSSLEECQLIPEKKSNSHSSNALSFCALATIVYSLFSWAFSSRKKTDQAQWSGHQWSSHLKKQYKHRTQEQQRRCALEYWPGYLFAGFRQLIATYPECAEYIQTLSTLNQTSSIETQEMLAIKAQALDLPGFASYFCALDSHTQLLFCDAVASLEALVVEHQNKAQKKAAKKFRKKAHQKPMRPPMSTAAPLPEQSIQPGPLDTGQVQSLDSSKYYTTDLFSLITGLNPLACSLVRYAAETPYETFINGATLLSQLIVLKKACDALSLLSNSTMIKVTEYIHKIASELTWDTHDLHQTYTCMEREDF